ncbi:acyl-coenzyme A thioesterase 13 isoform X1 [Halyomorpha halys]|uniref:acyl-coenzyme A thioesterase 13 isoform X1 n=1 Tax=Halyomorpha halys TaxID=286706 RepID=UPI0006D4F803|nr:acyl-coenzyme A thioesterase 13-like isoform X1 [Halyomorpha halys]
MAVSNIVKQAWNRLMERKVGFEQVLKKVTLTHAADGVCLAEMTVDQEHTNSIGTLHGGLTSTLVDTISGMALATKTKDGSVGVSIDLHVTFLKGVPLGEQIVIEAKTNKCGRTLAFLDVNIIHKATGDLVAKGSHTKFIKN